MSSSPPFPTSDLVLRLPRHVDPSGVRAATCVLEPEPRPPPTTTQPQPPPLTSLVVPSDALAPTLLDRMSSPKMPMEQHEVTRVGAPVVPARIPYLSLERLRPRAPCAVVAPVVPARTSARRRARRCTGRAGGASSEPASSTPSTLPPSSSAVPGTTAAGTPPATATSSASGTPPATASSARRPGRPRKSPAPTTSLSRLCATTGDIVDEVIDSGIGARSP